MAKKKKKTRTVCGSHLKEKKKKRMEKSSEIRENRS